MPLAKASSRDRSRWEPSIGFVEHTLAVTEVWVALHEYLSDPLTGVRDIQLDYRIERHAWRSHPDRHGATTTLKPDAELRLQCDIFEDRWWLEVDRATEHRTAIRRKLDAYIAYYRSGREQRKHGIFPLTAWLTTTDERARVLHELIDELPHAERMLFRVGHITAASPLLLSHGRHEL